MTHIYRFITLYNSVSFFQVPVKEKNTDTTESHGKYCGQLPAEVMQKIKLLKLIISLSFGLSFLTIIILSHWGSRLKLLLRLDVNYTGKKNLHLLAFKNAQRIPASISVKFSDINCHRISNDTFCASFPSEKLGRARPREFSRFVCEGKDL